MAPGIKTDLTGKIFGNLLVLKDSGKRHPGVGEILWDTQCVCGGNRVVRTTKLTGRKTKHCGCLTKVTRKLPGTYALRKKLREKLVSFNNVPGGIQQEIIFKFIKGERLLDICRDHKVETQSANAYLREFRTCLNTAWELHTIMKVKQDGNKIPQEALDDALVSKYVLPRIKPMLSKANGTSLTEQEIVYSWVFVNSGSNSTALDESGFAEVIKSGQKNLGVYRNLLGIFLREKLNVQRYISELRKEYIKNTDVSKQYVQGELVKQVEQLKEVCSSNGSKPADRSNLLKAIEMVGRSVGTFTDRIQVEEVNPKDALDLLMTKAKEEIITGGTYAIEDIS